MNKERLQEIIDIINSYPNTPYYPNICNELIQAVIKLQEDVNQLETNRDEAISLGNKQLLSNSNYTGYTDDMCLKEMLSILERGEHNND